MNYYYLFLFGFILPLVIAPSNKVVFECNTKWEVQGNSRLQINGQTNVNSFECLSVKYEGEDTIRERCDEEGVHYYNGKIKMQAKGFDCQHPVMSRDFRKTLEADRFPYIVIEFIDLKTNPEWEDDSRILGTVEITMAGITKDYLLECSVSIDDEGNKYLDGNQMFRFSEFGLDRPQKFFGAIKVKDEVAVDFHLKMQSSL